MSVPRKFVETENNRNQEEGGAERMNWYEISSVGAAIAFIVLVYYLITTLHALRAVLRKLEVSITLITQTIDDTTRLSRQVMRAMRGTLDDWHVKSRQMQGLYDAMADFGDAVKSASAAVRRASSALTNFLDKDRGRKAPDWVQAGIQIWREWMEHCRQGTGSSEDAHKNNKE